MARFRRGPDKPTALKKRSWFGTLKRAIKGFKAHNLTDWAAALTYYAVLSLFPALIALVSIVGLVGDPATTTKAITEMVTKLGPTSAADTFAGPIKSITSNRGAAGVLFVVGPNGAGKTALLRTLGGTLAPAGGERWIGSAI